MAVDISIETDGVTGYKRLVVNTGVIKVYPAHTDTFSGDNVQNWAFRDGNSLTETALWEVTTVSGGSLLDPVATKRAAIVALLATVDSQYLATGGGGQELYEQAVERNFNYSNPALLVAIDLKGFKILNPKGNPEAYIKFISSGGNELIFSVPPTTATQCSWVWQAKGEATMFKDLVMITYSQSLDFTATDDPPTPLQVEIYVNNF